MLILLLVLLSLASAVLGCLAGGAFAGLSWLWLLPLGFVGCALLSLLACLVLL